MKRRKMKCRLNRWIKRIESFLKENLPETIVEILRIKKRTNIYAEIVLTKPAEEEK